MKEANIQTYHFKEFVNNEGTVILSGLPPSTRVNITVTEFDLADWQARMKKFMQKVSKDHPFTTMSKDEILKHLRQNREEVYDELYGDRYAH